MSPGLLNSFRFGGAGAGFYRDFTLVHTQVGTSDLTDFPILIDYTDATLKDVAHGGHVQLSNGNDILPYLNTGMSSLSKFERESYDPTTGRIVIHAKMPTISHTTDILLVRLKYGDVADTTDQSDLPNTWSNGFARVVHMGDGSTLSGVDSVGGNNFAVTNATAAAGQIRGAGSFSNASNQYLKNSAVAVSARPIFFSAWFKMSTTTFGTSEERIIATVMKSAGDSGFWLSAFQDSGTGNIQLRVAEWSPGPGQFNNFAVITPDLNWHHIMGGYYTASPSVDIWLDGVKLSLSPAGVPQTPSGLTDSYIGGLFYNSGFGGQWRGLLDEVRFHNVDRSTSWALTEFNNQNNPSAFYTVSAETAL